MYFLDFTMEYRGKYSILLTLLNNNSILSSSLIRLKYLYEENAAAADAAKALTPPIISNIGNPPD